MVYIMTSLGEAMHDVLSHGRIVFDYQDMHSRSPDSTCTGPSVRLPSTLDKTMWLRQRNPMTLQEVKFALRPAAACSRAHSRLYTFIHTLGYK